ncbi:MAG: hypothetical protein M3Y71_03650 [Actinomycetota bacterium]|nr:hypothetical protein [Actinomycetota bacterium]
MTTITPDVQTPRPQPVDHRGGPRSDLLWRAAVVVAGTGSTLLGGPALLTGTLLLVGVLLAAERLAMMRRLGRLDALLVSVGGALTTLVLVGLGLGLTPLGLHRTTWAAALGAASVVALALAAVAPRPPSARWTRIHTVASLRTLPWVLAAVVVVGIAVSMSVQSVTSNGTAPVQMSLGRVEGTSVQVVISGSDAAGPVELRTAIEGNEVSYPLVVLDPARPTTVDVALPTSGRYTITLNRPDQTQPLRTLILDR